MAYTTNNPTVLIAVGAVVVIAIIFVIVMAIRRREIAFEGEVIDKDIIETRNNMPMNNMNPASQGGINIISGGGIQHEYKIKVKTATGKTIGYKISSGMYEVIKIGDMVSKPKGTTEVTIISKSPTTASAKTPSNSIEN